MLTGGRVKRPPQWAGLKFFNVYGPNEYHKGSMVSVVKVKHDDVLAGHAPKLFRSTEPGLADGQQMRDFIWVGDVVDVMLWLLASPGVNGLFNVGTGNARSYQHLAEAVCRAAQVPERIGVSSTCPPHLRAGYQSFTQATTDRLRDAGYGRPIHRPGGRVSGGYIVELPGHAGPVSLIPVLLFPQFDPVLDPARAAVHPLVCARLYRQPDTRAGGSCDTWSSAAPLSPRRNKPMIS